MFDLARAAPVALLDAEPDLGELLSPARFAEARRMLVTQVRTIDAGAWSGDLADHPTADDLGLLVLDGLLARDVVMADNVSSHLVGPGDVIRPWQRSDPGRLLRAESRWTVLKTVEVALLDRRVGASLVRYPEVNAMLIERLSDQMHRVAIAQAICQLNGVDRRLLALFWHVAERWGRVRPQGVVVPLAVSHRVLAGLVGARRPTVSTAIGRLTARGELERLEDGSWLLTGEPVGSPTDQAARTFRRRTCVGRRLAPPGQAGLTATSETLSTA